jgi:hypothetical protein
MMYEKLIPEKESSGDERKPGKPEQINYLSNANCYDKLFFGWAHPVIKVIHSSRSTATNRTSNRTTWKISPWRNSPSRSTASGTLTGRQNPAPTPRIP